MELVRVVLINLPHTIRGVTTYYFDEDGQVYYTIFLNARLNDEMQRAAYDHEIAHINECDFDKMVPIKELEFLRHTG